WHPVLVILASDNERHASRATHLGSSLRRLVVCRECALQTNISRLEFACAGACRGAQWAPGGRPRCRERAGQTEWLRTGPWSRPACTLTPTCRAISVQTSVHGAATRAITHERARRARVASADPACGRRAFGPGARRGSREAPPGSARAAPRPR